MEIAGGPEQRLVEQDCIDKRGQDLPCRAFVYTKGWLLDCYPSLSGEGGISFWIKAEMRKYQAQGLQLARKGLRFRSRLRQRRVSVFQHSGFVSAVNVVKKRTKISDWKRSNALEIELRQANKGKKVADLLESFFQNPSTFTLYNVDVSPKQQQQYFLEKDLFSLAHVCVYSSGGEITKWHMLDRVEVDGLRDSQIESPGI